MTPVHSFCIGSRDRRQRQRIFARHAAGLFAAILCGEILWGIGVGWLMLRLRHWVRDPRIEVMLSILTPFAAYWPPQHFGGSGVLATVTAAFISAGTASD